MNIFKWNAAEKVDPRIKNELADSYRSMVVMVAWKDLDKMMSSLIETTNKDIDNMPVKDLTVGDVARARGMREAIDKIRKHAYFYLDGQ